MMLSIAELERRCQKPDHARIGNWMARRVSRPAALRITRLVAPLGVSAHTATLAAWGLGAAAAAALAWGCVEGWLLAALLLQAWYLLDHVDGQLARLRGTSSLDGAQLDFLMHHTIHLLIPLGAGCGLFVRRLEPLWFLAGLGWGLALLLITLEHDARYKAFIVRLKRLHGRLEVFGGAGGRPVPQPTLPRRPLPFIAWVVRKACEMHVVMNLLTMAALAQWLAGDGNLRIAAAYLSIMALAATLVAGWTLIRGQSEGRTEREFTLWFQLPPGHNLVFRDGWWYVEESDAHSL